MARSSKSRSNPVVEAPAATDNSKPIHEIDSAGFHRIVCQSIVGPWFAYQQPAILKINGVVYYATTDYFHGSLPGGIFTVKSVK